MLHLQFLGVSQTEVSSALWKRCLQPIIHNHELLNSTSSKWTFCPSTDSPDFQCNPGVCSCPCLAFAVCSWGNAGTKLQFCARLNFSLLDTLVTPRCSSREFPCGLSKPVHLCITENDGIVHMNADWFESTTNLGSSFCLLFILNASKEHNCMKVVQNYFHLFMFLGQNVH